MLQTIKPLFYFLLGGVAFAFIWFMWSVQTSGYTSHIETLLDSSDGAFVTSDPSYTNIIISDKTLIIRAADGYTPTVKQSEGKPLVIIERNLNQKSATAFDKVIVENDQS